MSEKAGWVATLDTWYGGDWDSPVLARDRSVDPVLLWSYKLREWYPDWRPAAVAPSTPKEAGPTRLERVPAPVPMNSTREASKKADAPASGDPTPAARPAPAPKAAIPPPAIIKDETPAAKPAAKAGGKPAPAATQAPQIIEDGAAPAGDGKVRLYTIRQGDTLRAIAETFYGDPEQWTRIRSANPYVITNAKYLTVGATIRIP